MNPPASARFRWGTGIEDTNIGWSLSGSPDGLDEYQLTQHYERFDEDFRLAAELGAAAMRYGLPWYRLNPTEGEWDWEWPDRAVAAANHAGVELLIDLVHYGTPTWLDGSFADPRYPDAVAEYAGRVAERYRSQIGAITPLNEPLVTASFTGERGIWPPYLHGDEGWATVIVNLADGIQRTIKTVRSIAPELEILHVEATHLWTTVERGLDPELTLKEQKNYLPTDLVLGQVGSSHPLREWLEDHSIDPARLDALQSAAEAPDIIGLNYYPELSSRDLTRHDGKVVGVIFDGGVSGLAAIMQSFWSRYRLPLMISETAVEGSEEHRVEWLHGVFTEVANLIQAGIDIRGIIWWPLYDFVDWSWATGDLVVEEFFTRIAGQVSPVYPPSRVGDLDAYFRCMGLCRLHTEGNALLRTPTIVADAFRELSARADKLLPNL
jgi:beta-glucosidase/6-phospho-beta-glucosidase/beta-galactosidase